MLYQSFNLKINTSFVSEGNKLNFERVGTETKLASSPNKNVCLATWRGSYKMTEPTEVAQQILFGGSLNILCGKPLSQAPQRSII
jgi:hypothetical protein